MPPASLDSLALALVLKAKIQVLRLGLEAFNACIGRCVVTDAPVMYKFRFMKFWKTVLAEPGVAANGFCCYPLDFLFSHIPASIVLN